MLRHDGCHRHHGKVLCDYGEKDGRRSAAVRTLHARGNSHGDGSLIADAARHCMCPCDPEKRLNNAIVAATIAVATAVAGAAALAAITEYAATAATPAAVVASYVADTVLLLQLHSVAAVNL